MKVINADELISFVNGYREGYLHGSDGKDDHISVGETAGVIQALDVILDRIKEGSTVVERRGYWVNSEDRSEFPRCSCCGKEAWMDDPYGENTLSAYCPECGARMDAGVNNG